MKRSREVFFDTLRRNRSGGVAAGTAFVLSFAVFYLYGLPLEPFVYASLLAGFALLCFFIFDFLKGLSKAEEREQMINSALTGGSLPGARTLAERDLLKVIGQLRNELVRLSNEFESQRSNEKDYYTAWVHQIKTPISVMRMELGSCEEENARIFEAELFRIEQYVDMVLQYIRLGSGSSDLVIKEYPLDTVIREAIRKFAPQFVLKKLSLCYEGTGLTVVTDKKWFSCILEQLLSNAIKYTPSGGITVLVENGMLIISDTGIGIAPEDIPRIFEKGFTGENGRLEKRSSGLGLYLCKKAADLLCIPLSVTSEIGKGSVFTIGLKEKLRR